MSFSNLTVYCNVIDLLSLPRIELQPVDGLQEP
jgi:hypothetical protein